MNQVKINASTPSSQSVTSLSGATGSYGLAGLLSLIHMTDPNLNTLSLGTELTTLGLDLNSQEYVIIGSFTG